MGSLRDLILAAEDLPRVQVQTDEWAPFGVPFVYVRSMTAQERDSFEQGTLERGPDGRLRTKIRQKNMRAEFVALVLVDENGDQVFKSQDDVKRLGEKNAAVLDRLWTEARKINGMLSEEEEAEENPFGDEVQGSNYGDSDSPSES